MPARCRNNKGSSKRDNKRRCDESCAYASEYVACGQGAAGAGSDSVCFHDWCRPYGASGTCTRSQGYHQPSVYKMGRRWEKTRNPHAKNDVWGTRKTDAGKMPFETPFVPQDKSGQALRDSGQAGATKSEKQIPITRKGGAGWGPGCTLGYVLAPLTGLDSGACNNPCRNKELSAPVSKSRSLGRHGDLVMTAMRCLGDRIAEGFFCFVAPRTAQRSEGQAAATSLRMTTAEINDRPSRMVISRGLVWQGRSRGRWRWRCDS